MRGIDRFCPLLGKMAGKMMDPYLPIPEPEREWDTEQWDTFHHCITGKIIVSVR